MPPCRAHALGLLVASVTLAACGGGGSGSSGGGGGGGGGGGSPVLFEDKFDGGLGQWVLSNGQFTLDPSIGAPSPPSLRISSEGSPSGQATATMNSGGFRVEGGLAFFVRVRVPSEAEVPVAQGLDFPLLIIRRAGSAQDITLLTWRRSESGTDFRFYANGPSFAPAIENIGFGQVNGQFFDFGCIIQSDGGLFWTRDGVVKATRGIPLTAAALDDFYTIALRTAATLQGPAFPVHFDDVQVTR